MTAAFLALVLAPIALMILAMIGASQHDVLSSRAWSIAPWTLRPMPIVRPIEIGTRPALWVQGGTAEIKRPRLRDSARDVTAAHDPQSVLQSVGRLDLKDVRLVVGLPMPQGPAEPGIESLLLNGFLSPLQRIAFERLGIARSTLMLPGPSGSEQRLEALEAEISANEGRGLSSIRGKFVFRGETVTLDATLGNVSEKEGRLSAPLKLTVQSRHAEVTFDGQATQADLVQLAGRLDLTSPDLRALARWLGSTLPPGPGLGPLQMRGTATWRKGVLALDNTTVTIDANTALGALALDLRRERPHLDGTLAFKQLDIAPYLDLSKGIGQSESGSADRPRAGGSAGEPRPSPSLRFSLLDHIDADLRVSANKVTGLGLATGKGALSLTLKAGTLVADLAALEIDAGTASGQARITNATDTVGYDVQGRLDKVPVEALLGRLLGSQSRALEGSGSLQFNLASRGETLADLVGALEGQMRVVLADGGRAALDLPALVSAAQTQKSLMWSSQGRPEMSFDEASARFTVKAGQAVSNDLRLRSGGFAVSGSGSIRLLGGDSFMRIVVDSGPVHGRGSGNQPKPSVMMAGPWNSLAVWLDETEFGYQDGPRTMGAPEPGPAASKRAVAQERK